MSVAPTAPPFRRRALLGVVAVLAVVAVAVGLLYRDQIVRYVAVHRDRLVLRAVDHDLRVAENAERNPMAAMMYGNSVLTCMASALSEPEGAGLGTLGLSADRAEAMVREAGFTRFRRLEVDHPVSAFYEVRP